MSSNELFSDDAAAPESPKGSDPSRPTAARKLGKKGFTRLVLGLVLLVGTFTGLTVESLLTAAPAFAAQANSCTAPASGGTSQTFVEGVANESYSVACQEETGISGTSAYPTITINTGSLPADGSPAFASGAGCTQTTSGSGATEEYITTCKLTDSPTSSDAGAYPLTFTSTPGAFTGSTLTATNSGTLTVNISAPTVACIDPAAAGTAVTWHEGVTSSYTVECEEQSDVSGVTAYPSSLVVGTDTLPSDANPALGTCTTGTSGSGATEEYIKECPFSATPTASDTGSYAATFTATGAGGVGSTTSGNLNVTVNAPTVTCIDPASAGSSTTFSSSAGGTANAYTVECEEQSGLSGVSAYPTSIAVDPTSNLPTDSSFSAAYNGTGTLPSTCVHATSGSGATEFYILECDLNETAVTADNGSYTGVFDAVGAGGVGTVTSGTLALTVSGPTDVCTAPANGGTATTFKAGIANTYSVSCYGTGFASANAGNYPASITLNTGSLPADATEATSTSSSPACTQSTSGSGLAEQYILTCAITETPTASDIGTYPVTFTTTPGANGGTTVTSGTWTLTVAALNPTCIDPASGGSPTTFFEGSANAYTVECEAQSGISGESAYPATINIATGALPADGNPTFATSTSSSPACTHGTSGSGATEEYITECALSDTPTSADTGSYPLTFTATGPGGAGAGTVTSGTLTVTISAPTTTCSAPAAGGTSTSWTDGTASSYSVVCYSQGFATSNAGNYPSTITLNSGTLPANAHESTSTGSSPACTQSTSGSGTTEEYILTCPVTDTPVSSENGTYHATFLATGGASGAPNATSGTWTLTVSQPAPSWETDGSTDGNYFSAVKGVPFCYDLAVTTSTSGGATTGSPASLPLTSLTAGTTPANVSNYSIQNVNLAAGTGQICGTNNNTAASAPVTMAPVATNTGGSATDSIPLWSQNECTWTSTGATVSMFDSNQDLEQAGSQSAFGAPISNGATGGSTKDTPTCTGGVGVSASGGLGDAWTINTANPLPTPTDTNPSAAQGDLASSNLDLTSASSGSVGGCWGGTNILASTSTTAFGSGSTASMTLPSSWVNGGTCAYGSLGSNSAGGNTDTPALSGPTGDAACPPNQADVNAGYVNCGVIVSSGNDENGSTNYSTLDLLYNGQPVPQTPTATLSASTVQAGNVVSVTGGSNWWGDPNGAPDANPTGDDQNSASDFYPVGAPSVTIGTSRATAVPVVNSTITIPANTYVCTGAESNTVGPNPCTLTVGQPTGTFQVPSGLSPGNYNVYIDESNTSPLPGNGPNDSYQTAAGRNLGTVESATPVVVPSAPTITSANSTTFTESSAGTFTVTTTGTPTPSLSETGALPSGVTFTDNGDGTATLAGTPAVGTAGSYPITIGATNGVSPDASQSFTLTVNAAPAAPAITSANSTTFVESSAGTFTVTTSGNPTPALSETGALPSGVTFTDNGDGTATLAGTPAVGTAGSYPITIGATNGVSPDASQSFTLTVSAAPAAPAITSANSTTFVESSAGTFTVTTTGNPTPALSETGSLPSGVTFTDNGDGTGTLAGTPDVGTAGSYPITIGATNGVSPDASQSFTLMVSAAPAAPAITSANSTTFVESSAGTFTVTTTGSPTPALSATGSLPSGVVFTDNGDGTATLAGTPAVGTAGSYPITIGATNGVSPDASQSFTLTVSAAPAAPAITSANHTTFTVGSAGTFTVTTTGNPTPALSETGSLPSGVTFTDNGDGTATLAGTPGAGTAGSYPITIGATNGVSPDASQSFTLTVSAAPAAPAITSANHTTFTVGSAGTFTVTTTGNPTPSLTKTGSLPSGVTFTNNGDGTATLAGTPATGTAGSYPITIGATNGVSPNASQSFTLTVNAAPTFTSQNSTTFMEGQANTFSVTTSGSPTPDVTLYYGSVLPSGVHFTDNHNGTGTISGTPTQSGTFSQIAFEAQNGVSPPAYQFFTLTVTAGFHITTSQAPNGKVGTAYSFQLQATGGTPAYNWSASSLPAGLSLSGKGVLSSKARNGAQAGTYHISVTVTDHTKPVHQTATGTVTVTFTS